MTLLPEEIRERITPKYSTDEQGEEAQAVVKFFTDASNWTWYVTEFDGKDTFFGLVIGLEVELGYFNLTALESVGQAISRDLYFEPKSIKELKAFYAEKGYAY